MNRATSAILVLLVLLIVIQLALLGVSVYDRLREADCCSHIEASIQTTKCVLAASTARYWRNEANRLWNEELAGNQPDCDEFNSVVDNLSDAADRCREVCALLDCPSKALSPGRCRVE